MAYDDTNIFARILRGELPCDKIHEDEFALAFHDINPQAPVHALVIPKGAYVDMNDFAAGATDAEFAGLFRAGAATAHALGVKESGYRVRTNTGADAHQEVMHLHLHIFGGRPLGPMLEGGDLPPDGTFRR